MAAAEIDADSTRPGDGGTGEAVGTMQASFRERLGSEIDDAGGERPSYLSIPGSVGSTTFDLPGSEDGAVTVLLPPDRIGRAPLQALVRIISYDGLRYLGIISSGPFAEPDTIRGDSNILTSLAARGKNFTPPYHGRVRVSILGQEIDDLEGDESAPVLSPPRRRPLPNSPVFALTTAEAARVLRAEGDIRLGVVAGYDDLVAAIPSTDKQVLPRHTAVLGTTGAGKSTTVSGLIQQAQAAGMAVILLDVEGEYTSLHEPTEDRRMLAGLKKRRRPVQPLPVEQMALYHLVGRETANREHPRLRTYCLRFEDLSPYTVIEILGMSDAQDQRYWVAYGLARAVLRDMGIFPQKDVPRGVQTEQEQEIANLDDFERGYPRLTLSFMLDVVNACLATVNSAPFEPFDPHLRSEAGRAALAKVLNTVGKDLPKNASSWGKVRGLLWRLHRLKVFDLPAKDARPIDYRHLLTRGSVSVFDLSDSGMSELSNLVIATLLRGVHEAQDRAYRDYEEAKKQNPTAEPPTRVLLIIEEAHEFLSAERIEKQDMLFRQVATIAKRGRKRWLGLVFVTQLPQHLPRQVFGLVNGYILHKITDPQVVSSLQRVVAGVDESLWRQLPGLAPGQAIVSFQHMTQPLLLSIDPTPSKLRLID